MAIAKFSSIDRLGLATSMSIGCIDSATNSSIQSVADALDAIILGANIRATKTVATVVDIGSATPPADLNANRDHKWLLRFQDGLNGNIYTHEIGTADPAQLPAPTSDFVSLTAGNGLALKTAIDSLYRSPDNNAGTLLSVQDVSRTG